MSNEKHGKIVKALSGFYYVNTGENVITCRARGKFRRADLSPLVGDEVTITMTGREGTVETVAPRRNQFVRPPVANLDGLVIFAANVNPITDPYLIDRVAAIAGDQQVPVLICINKYDLDPGERLETIYRNAGFPVVCTSAETAQGLDELMQWISGKVTAFTGNSGVGKSSILNRLCPSLALKTGEVSEKLGRGRHTTRHVELYDLGGGTLVVDTPGFSSFDTDQMDLILKENLQYAFTDFAPFLGSCQFHDCAHIHEPGCAVLEALSKGQLEPTRHDSYVRLYEKVRLINTWEQKR